MSDSPFSADQEHGSSVNTPGLLERLKARQHPLVSPWVRERLLALKAQRQPGELAGGAFTHSRMALTIDSTRQLLQRVRGGGQHTRAWRPDIGTLTPSIFQLLPAEISQRLQRINPLGLHGMRREAAPSPAQTSADLVLPTGRSEPAAQMGPASPVPTLSAGMVIPPMAPPGFASREADKSSQSKKTGKSSLAEPRQLPPRARLYSRIEEYHPGKAESAAEPAPAVAQPDAQPSLSAPPATPAPGDTGGAPAVVQRAPELPEVNLPGLAKPAVKSPEQPKTATQLPVTAEKSPGRGRQAGASPSSQPPTIQRTPASRQPEDPETRAPLTRQLSTSGDTKKAPAPAPRQPVEPESSATEATSQAPTLVPTVLPGAHQSPVAEHTQGELPIRLVSGEAVQHPAETPGETLSPPTSPVQVESTIRSASPKPAGEASQITQPVDSDVTLPSLPLARPKAVLRESETYIPLDSRQAVMARPRPTPVGKTSAPKRPAERAAARPVTRPVVPPVLARAKAAPRSSQLSPTSPLASPLVKARQAGPAPAAIQRIPAPGQKPALKPGRGEPSTAPLPAIDQNLPGVEPAFATPAQLPDQGSPDLPAAQLYSTAVSGIDSHVAQMAPQTQPPITLPGSPETIAGKRPRLVAKSARQAPPKAEPRRTMLLRTTGVQQSRAPAIQRQPGAQPAPAPAAASSQPGAPEEAIEYNTTEAPASVVSPRPPVDYILQRAARKKALVAGVQAKKIEPQTLRRPLLSRAVRLGQRSITAGQPGATQSLPAGQSAVAIPPAPSQPAGATDLSQAFAGLPAIFKIPPSNQGEPGLPLPIPGVMHVPEKLRELLEAATSGSKKPELSGRTSPYPPSHSEYQAQPELPLRQLPQQVEAERVNETEQNKPPAETQSKPVSPSTLRRTRQSTSGLIQRVETETAVTDVTSDKTGQIDYRDLAQRVLPYLKKLIAIEGERGIHLRR